MSEVEINQRAADRIRCGGPLNDKHQPGDWLALLDGNIVAVAKDVSSVLCALRVIDPDPNRGMVVEAVPPVTDVIR